MVLTIILSYFCAFYLTVVWFLSKIDGFQQNNLFEIAFLLTENRNYSILKTMDRRVRL